MADVMQAIGIILRQEDSTLSGVVTNTAHDMGGTTRYGLCAKNFPQLQAEGFYDASTVPAAQALPMAQQAYNVAFAEPLMLAQITSQAAATAFLSFAVNDGMAEAVLLMQRALIACGQAVKVDGKMGPGTLGAINAVDGTQLVQALCQAQTAYYHQIVADNPTQSCFLNGWLNRVAGVQQMCNA